MRNKCVELIHISDRKFHTWRCYN